MSLENQLKGKPETINGFTEMVQTLGLADQLGLTDDIDKDLLAFALFARLQRNPSSERAELLKNPMLPIVRTFPIIGHMVAKLEDSEQRHQAEVDETELQLKTVIEEFYPSPETQQRAQTIVSAVNMLVATGLERGGNKFTGGNLFRYGRPFLIFENLNSWGEYWKPRISPTQPK